MNLVERFLRYVSFDTQSDDNSGVTPSTPKQMVFAQFPQGHRVEKPVGYESTSYV